MFAVLLLLALTSGGADAVDQATALSSGGSHNCAVTTGGGVECWGDNNFGELGDGTTNSNLNSVTVNGLSSGISSVSAGNDDSCALTTGGGVKCWGKNNKGQLGATSTATCGFLNDPCSSTPLDVTGLTSGIKAIATGGDIVADHTCALTAAGGVKCWGYNVLGQVGDGSTTDRSAPTNVVGLTSGVSVIATGSDHSCAVQSGAVKCWGDGYYGEIGDAGCCLDGEWVTTPATVTGLSDATSVVGGSFFSCALTTGHAVKCWGWNDRGQLGIGNTNGPDTCSDDGTQNDIYYYCSKGPAQVTGLTGGIAAIAAGANHACALTTGGGVKCWGENSYGQLGNGTDTGPEQCVVFPRGEPGQSYEACSSTPVDVVGLQSGVIAITAGSSHTCALLSGGSIKCWGAAGYALGCGASGRDATVPIDVVDCSSTHTPSATPTQAETPTPSVSPTSTPPSQLIWGNVDCSLPPDPVDIGDAIDVERSIVHLPVTKPADCPAIGDQVMIAGNAVAWGNVDCSLPPADIGDAIDIERSIVRLPVTKPDSCPAIGDPISDAPTPTATPTPTPQWSATNFHWYEALPAPSNDCDLTKSIPPGNPFIVGLCATLDLQIPDANYTLRIVWGRNGTFVADNSYPNFHLFAATWHGQLTGVQQSGTYSLTWYANGVLLGTGQIVIAGGPTPTPTPSFATVNLGFCWIPVVADGTVNGFFSSAGCTASGDRRTVVGCSRIASSYFC